MERLPPPTLGPIGRLFASLAAILAGIGVLMFSLVLFAILLTLGLGFGLYLWWKTRGLRAAMREQMAQAGRATDEGPRAAGDATVIEGEYVRIEEVEQGSRDAGDRC